MSDDLISLDASGYNYIITRQPNAFLEAASFVCFF